VRGAEGGFLDSEDRVVEGFSWFFLDRGVGDDDGGAPPGGRLVLFRGGVCEEDEELVSPCDFFVGFFVLLFEVVFLDEEGGDGLAFVFECDGFAALEEFSCSLQSVDVLGYVPWARVGLDAFFGEVSGPCG